MNPLLFIANITSSKRIRKFCAIKRNKQWNKKWDKEKATTVMVAIESTDELWDLSWDLD